MAISIACPNDQAAEPSISKTPNLKLVLITSQSKCARNRMRELYPTRR